MITPLNSATIKKEEQVKALLIKSTFSHNLQDLCNQNARRITKHQWKNITLPLIYHSSFKIINTSMG
jgi:hypothetical protein